MGSDILQEPINHSEWHLVSKNVFDILNKKRKLKKLKKHQTNTQIQ